MYDTRETQIRGLTLVLRGAGWAELRRAELRCAEATTLGLVSHDLPQAPANNLTYTLQSTLYTLHSSVDSNCIIGIHCLVIVTLRCRLFGFPYLVSDTS